MLLVASGDRPSGPHGYRMREGDGNDGWLVEVDVRASGLRLHFSEIRELSSGPPGPLDKNGVPRQIYVARLRPEEAERLAEAAGSALPDDLDASLLGLPASRWDEGETDSETLTKIRLEQGELRKHLLGGRAAAPCAICGRLLPDRLLIAAHIVPRRNLTDAERVDFTSVAMLACVLGCDALFRGATSS